MKNFSEIYQKLYKENHEELEALRQESKKKHIIALACIVLLAIIISLTINTGIGVFVGILGLLISCVLPFSSELNKAYKFKVIKNLVKYYDDGLEFSPTMRISSFDYRQAEFESYDNFYSNDLIFGKIDKLIKFQAGDVRTEDVSTDSDGNTTRTTLFSGLFSVAEFDKNINSTIKIRSDKGILGKLIKSKELMQMDSQEFEKQFDVYASDKILAMRILTSDILDYMLTFKTKNKVKFEITLKDYKLYVRIRCQDLFEVKQFKDSMDFDTLNRYYNFIDFICELNRKIYYVLSEKDL